MSSELTTRKSAIDRTVLFYVTLSGKSCSWFVRVASGAEQSLAPLSYAKAALMFSGSTAFVMFSPPDTANTLRTFFRGLETRRSRAPLWLTRLLARMCTAYYRTFLAALVRAVTRIFEA